MNRHPLILFRGDVIMSLIIFVFLLFSTLKRTSGPLQDLGALSIIVLLLFGFLLMTGYLAKIMAVPIAFARLLIPALAFVGVYILGLIQGDMFLRSLVVVAQLFLVLIFFFSMAVVRWRRQAILTFAFGASMFVFCNFFFLIYSGMPALFSSYMAHKNSLGGFLFGLFFFLFVAFHEVRSNSVYRVFWCVVIVFGLILFYYTNSRASWLALISVMTTMMLWKFITKTKKRFNLYFLSMILLLFLVTLVYPYLAQIEGLIKVRELVQHYTGADLFTGRDRLWPVLIERISMHPILGYGSGALPRDFMITTLSSHNIYLQITLQVGLFGMFFFLFLLYRLWDFFWRGRELFVVRLSAAYLIGIMIHQLFDISLTQNNMTLGLLQWLILAIGVSAALNGCYRYVSQVGRDACLLKTSER